MEAGSRKFCQTQKTGIELEQFINQESASKENTSSTQPVKYKFKDVKTDELKIIYLNSKPAENDNIPSPPENTGTSTAKPFKHYTIESYFGKPKTKAVSNVNIH